jgi:hypothetical protein
VCADDQVEVVVLSWLARAEVAEARADLNLKRTVQLGHDRYLSVVVQRRHPRVPEKQCRPVVVPAVGRREVVVSEFGEFPEWYIGCSRARFSTSRCPVIIDVKVANCS